MYFLILHCVIQRALAFACFRGICNNIPIEALIKISEPLTRVAVRELTDDGVSSEIKLEAEKLTSILRSALGNADFNALYAKVNDYYHKKRNINRAKKKESVSYFGITFWEHVFYNVFLFFSLSCTPALSGNDLQTSLIRAKFLLRK